MQVSHTLIAAQQAAREARARLQVQNPQQPRGADFARALEKPGFAPLPLRQTAAPPAPSAPPAQPAAPARMGSRLDITV
jgi:hypothetical protein